MHQVGALSFHLRLRHCPSSMLPVTLVVHLQSNCCCKRYTCSDRKRTPSQTLTAASCCTLRAQIRTDCRTTPSTVVSPRSMRRQWLLGQAYQVSGRYLGHSRPGSLHTGQDPGSPLQRIHIYRVSLLATDLSRHMSSLSNRPGTLVQGARTYTVYSEGIWPSMLKRA